MSLHFFPSRYTDTRSLKFPPSHFPHSLLSQTRAVHSSSVSLDHQRSPDDNTTKNYHLDLPIQNRHSIKGIKGIEGTIKDEVKKGIWRRVLLVMALEEFTAVIWTLWPWFLGAVSSGTHSTNVVVDLTSIRNRHLPVIVVWNWQNERCLCCDSDIFKCQDRKWL